VPTELGNSLIVGFLLLNITINIWLCLKTRDRSFLWMVAGMVYGLAIRSWLLLDDLEVCHFPMTSYGATVMVFMYAGESMGWVGIARALDFVLHNFPKKRQNDDRSATGGPSGLPHS